MAVTALQGAGMDPSYVVGGELRSTGANAGWGSGEWIVVEADESDRSLLKLEPEIAILTSAELDHHSTYASLLDLEATLRTFMARAGRARGGVGPARSCGPCAPAAACPTTPPTSGSTREARTSTGGASRSASRCPGAHNAVNAAGALTACALAGADPVAAAAALAGFGGARRRMERVGETPSGAVVYDDYAHHPTEVAATLAAARSLDARRLVAVFQPHLYSRTRALARAFGRALAAADAVVVLGHLSGARAGRGLPGRHRPDGGRVRGRRRRRPHRSPGCPDSTRRATYLSSILHAGDLCLMMGAGNIDALGRSLVV